MVLPEVLDQPQAARPLQRLRRQPLLVQDQEVGVLDGAHDLVDRAGEAETPGVVGVELAEGGVGSIGAVEPGQVDVVTGEDLPQRQGDGLGRRVLAQQRLLHRGIPARPGAHAEQGVADAVPDDDFHPFASHVLPHRRHATRSAAAGAGSIVSSMRERCTAESV